MLLEERGEDDRRICAGAVEWRAGEGCVAPIVVSRTRGRLIGTRETCRHESLASSRRWASSQPAVLFMMVMGQKMLKAERRRLAAGKC